MTRTQGICRAVVAVPLAMCLANVSVASARSETPSSDARPDHPVNGARALEVLGSGLSEVARSNGLSGATLRALLRTDPSLWVDHDDEIYYAEPVVSTAGQTRRAAATAAVRDPHFPLVQTFGLHSRPGAERTIFLDFDGGSIGSGWGYGGVDDEHPGWSFDADPSFDSVERAFVQDVWARVGEDFAPFDIDVTTEDPGDDALDRSSLLDTQFGTRVLVTPDEQAAEALCPPGGCGGLAFLSVFDRVDSLALKPALVFSHLLGARAKVFAEVISHETGHNLGLSHDGTTSTVYYDGHDSWAPIMGSGSRGLTQWSAGEYSDASNNEDDLAIIAEHGGPLVPDEAGSAPPSAGSLPANSALITSTDDVDVWALPDCAGSRSVVATTASHSPDLDLRLELIDALGTVLASADPVAQSVKELQQDQMRGLSAQLTTEPMTSSPQFARIRGVGNGTADTGYTAYGSVGAYSLEASCGERPVPAAPRQLVAFGMPGYGDVLVSWKPAVSVGDSPITGYRVSSSDGTTHLLDPSALSDDWRDLALGTDYTFSVRATSADGMSQPASVTVTTATVWGDVLALAVDTDVEAREVTVSWEPPDIEGTYPLQNYVVWLVGPGAPVTVSTATRSHTFSDMLVGSEVSVAVCAHSISTSACSTVRGVVGDRPGSPTMVAAKVLEGGRSASLTWGPPLDDGGVAVSGYEIRTDGSPWQVLAASASGAEFTVAPGRTHILAVRAVNAVGPGVSAEARVETAPTAPTNLHAAGGNARATLTWSKPDSDSSAITGYKITGTPGGTTTIVTDADVLTATVTGLTNGAAYTFNVSATSAAGDSVPSLASNEVTPAGVPARVGRPAARVRRSSVTITWALPSANGSAITRYLVVAAKGAARTIATSSRSVTYKRLDPGRYEFTVTAVNAAGAAKPSQPVTVRVRRQ